MGIKRKLNGHKARRRWVIGAVVVLSTTTAFLLGILCAQKTDFQIEGKIAASDIIDSLTTIILAVLAGYWLTELKADSRIEKSFALKGFDVLREILRNVRVSVRAFKASSKQPNPLQTKVLSEFRSFSYRLSRMEKKLKTYGIYDEVRTEFIAVEEELQSYRQFFDNDIISDPILAFGADEDKKYILLEDGIDALELAVLRA